MAQVFIALGSNIEPAQNIRAALHLLADAAPIVAISTFYETPPLERPRQAPFYNGVVEIATDLFPADLKFKLLRGIESQLGRIRSDDKYAPRPIDLDILLYGECIVSTDDLQIPDPDIASRPFLSFPLAELAGDLLLPGTGQTIRQIAPHIRPHTMQPLLEYSRHLREEFINNG